MTFSPTAVLLDTAPRRRLPATLPGSHAAGPPPNKRSIYPAESPTVEETIAVVRAGGEDCGRAR
jgi:hypothetical protein